MSTAFAIPPRLAAKSDPVLIAADERHFAAIEDSLRTAVADTEHRLAELRLRQADSGQEALERDLDVHRLSARLRILRRFGLDACLGRMVDATGAATYIGRFGLTSPDGGQLLVDWRAPAAEPFFAATHAQPEGLTSRRRYRWTGRLITDYWDEIFAADGVDHTAALDDQSAFIASLGANRSPRMRDVLATIQSDQDAIIRASSHGALVVDGGPGTGKTVVALHRAAYLLYADPRLQAGRGGILFVGPHRPYLDYIDDVLPSLGEDGALTCTLRDLVSGGAALPAESDAEIRALKDDARLIHAVERAVRLWQRIPTRTVGIDTAWGVVDVDGAAWADVFAGAGVSDSTDVFAGAPELAHNEVRAAAWSRLLDLLEERIADDVRNAGSADGGEGWGDASSPSGDDFDAYGAGWDADESIREALEQDEQLHAVFDRMWPLLDPDALLRGLLATPEMLRLCAPWLDDAAITTLGAAMADRAGAGAGAGAGWTDADLPLLDAVRRAVGDPRTEVRRRHAHREAVAAQRLMSDVVTDLIAADDSDLRVMSMLRGQDLRRTLEASVAADVDELAGPFAHIIVDEAQELTDAQWQMLLSRCPSRSFTIVGDRAQARHGFAESWAQRLERVGLRDVTVSRLTVNYRTPEEVMAVAEPVIRAAIPDANVPTSIRHSGVPVRHGRVAELEDIVEEWLAAHAEGVACVIGDPSFAARPRVSSLTAETVKGLEFDLVVLVDAVPTHPASSHPASTDLASAVDRYVAMTRATRELALLAG